MKTSLLIIVIISLTICTKSLYSQEAPKIVDGILDLSEYDFEKDGSVDLSGFWEFYWEKFLTPSEIKRDSTLKPDYIYAPATWISGKNGSKVFPSHGYATYRVRIKLPKNADKAVMLNLPRIVYAAYDLWVDDSLYCRSGVISKREPEISSGTTQENHLIIPNKYNKTGRTVDIVVQLSNHYLSGDASGMFLVPKIGEPVTMIRNSSFSLFTETLLLGFIIIMGIYHFFLYFFRKNEISTLIFAIISLLFAIRGLATADIYNKFFAHNYYVIQTMAYGTLSVYFFGMLLFFFKLFPGFCKKWFLQANGIIAGVLLSIVFFAPYFYVTSLDKVFVVLFLPGTVYILYLLYKSIRQKQQGAKWAFAGMLLLLYTNINDSLVATDILKASYKSTLGFSLYILFQSINIAQRFSNSFKENLKLNATLDYQNKNLEKIVEVRTEEVQTQKKEILIKNEELNQFNEEIQAQADNLQEAFNKIEFQNSEIISGIQYASTIQNAILPSIREINKHFETFIVFRPKDIVSGDFYWFTNFPATDHLPGKTLVAAVDCTGHGVPGAFMSMIGSRLLNEIVNEKHITATDEVLERLKNGIIEALNQEQNDSSDGMDLCLCSIEKLNSDRFEISFTGAKRPLFYKSKNSEKVEILKGDRISIGGSSKGLRNLEFTRQTIILEKGDCIYLTSDGFQDQNNVNREKIGSTNLVKLISESCSKSIEEQKKSFERYLDSHSQGVEQRDDITVIGIKL